MAYIQRGSVLTAADAAFNYQHGYGVAVSDSGLVMAVGAPGWTAGTLSYQGGVYLYDWSGSAWVQRGGVLVPSDAAASNYFGRSVSLSADGAVLAVGAEGRSTNFGGVYLFDWSGTAWVQRGAALTAADPGDDYYGRGVALSADGAILAVGAVRWDGAATDQGAVYIYDWSGTAWTQRGSVLTAGDAAAYDYFGGSVALSATGTLLAVGVGYWEGAATNQGGVYLYDYSGGAWVQRGSVLNAVDAALGDEFGSAVALSPDGLTLAVGAKGWEGTVSDQGGVYLYGWSGTDWVQSGSVLAAADGASFDGFGAALALTNNSATVLIVGAPDRDLPSYSSQGGVYVFDLSVPGVASAPTQLTLELAIGVASAPAVLTLTDVGTPSAPARLTLTAIGAPSAPAALTVTWPTGAASAPSALTVTGSGSASAATALALVGSGHAPLWRARCVIGGVDVSAQLTGQASVTAAEGAARIAQLTLQPPSGAIMPLDYVGKTISLDYVQVISGAEVPQRLFTGRVDTPAYDPDTTLLQLTCTDDLQNRVAGLGRGVIDALVGGRYAAAVQGEHDDGWDYAQARLETVSASLDAGASGGFRVTPWHGAPVWATFGEGDLLYQRASLSLPQRSTLVNRVDIAFSYRYNRLRQRFSSAGWSGTQIDMAPCGWAYPSQQDILGAAGGTGWTVTEAFFMPAPAAVPHSSGGFIYPPDGAIDMAIVKMTQRHSQTVTEGYTLTVSAPESVSANGELVHAIRGALESKFSGSAWESALDVAPLFEADGEQDYAPDAPRSSAEYAIQTLLDQASVKILGSHRSARVGNAILCNPDLDVDKRVAISTAAMSAEGKVASVTHTLDFMAGSALSAFELAVSGAGGAGILTPSSLTPPASPADAANDAQDWPAAVPSMATNTYGVTPYNSNIMGLLLNPPETITVENVPGQGTLSLPNPFYVAGSYPATGFRMRMPGVDDASRNPVDLPVSSSYSIVIPTDTLTFTIP